MRLLVKLAIRRSLEESIDTHAFAAGHVEHRFGIVLPGRGRVPRIGDEADVFTRRHAQHLVSPEPLGLAASAHEAKAERAVRFRHDAQHAYRAGTRDFRFRRQMARRKALAFENAVALQHERTCQWFEGKGVRQRCTFVGTGRATRGLGPGDVDDLYEESKRRPADTQKPCRLAATRFPDHRTDTAFQASSEALSMTKRYFTSPFTMRS